MNELLENWLARKKPDTKRAYISDLNDFAAFMQDELDEAIDYFLSLDHQEGYALAHDYAVHLESKQLAPRTLNRRLASLRSLTGHAQKIGMIGWSLQIAGRKVRKIKDTSGPGLEGVRDIIAAAELSERPSKNRDAAIVWLTAGLALRRMELSKLDLCDIVDDKLTVIRKAQDEATTLTMPKVVKTALMAWIQERGIWHGPLFTRYRGVQPSRERLSDHSINTIVKRLANDAGIDTTTNGLRHTSNTLATIFTQDSGLPIEEVLAHTGHADVRTAMIYRDNLRMNQLRIAEGVVAQFDLA